MVIGLDGKDKMSKSLNNYLEISASPEEITAKIKTAVTDPARVYRKDVGHPSVCNIYRFQEYFNPSQVAEIAQKCTTAEIGCVECKMIVAREIIQCPGTVPAETGRISRQTGIRQKDTDGRRGTRQSDCAGDYGRSETKNRPGLEYSRSGGVYCG